MTLTRTRLLVVLASLLMGCAPLVVYSEIQYSQLVDEGKAPPRSLLRACNQEGLERGPDGDWVNRPEVVTECLAKAGWAITADGWVRQ
jgi:hypothetical protein